MTAGHGHFHRALDVALAFYIAEINVVALMGRKKASQIGARGQEGRFPAQKIKRLPQILHTIDVDFIDHGGFERVGLRDKQCTLAAPPGFQRDWQDPFHGAHCAIQSQLAHKAKIFEGRAIQFFGHCNHPKRNR